MSGDKVSMASPCHPGEILRENLRGGGVTAVEMADELGMSRAALNRILEGKGGVTAATALALERSGRGEAETWMRLQMAYDLARLRNAAA